MEKNVNFNVNARTRMLVYLTAGVILIFLFVNFFFPALGLKIKNIDKQIKLKEVELKSAINIQNKKEDIAADYKAYNGYLAENKISEADMLAGFLKEVESIAQRTKVSIVNFTPGDQSREIGGNKVFYADARLEATPDQFYSFLNAIHASRLLIKVDKLVITAKDENASALRVDATISMTVL